MLSAREVIPNDLAVDGARNAILELQVHLWNDVLGEDRGIRDISCGTSGSVMDHGGSYASNEARFACRDYATIEVRRTDCS